MRKVMSAWRGVRIPEASLYSIYINMIMDNYIYIDREASGILMRSLLAAARLHCAACGLAAPIGATM
jgi:hypothetical protein